METNGPTEPTPVTFSVDGIVAKRNGQPYVQIKKDGALIAQFAIAETRSFAQDLMLAASHAEADAMLHQFFKKMDLPMNALGALMLEFRIFRHQLATEKVDKKQSDPDTGEQIG